MKRPQHLDVGCRAVPTREALINSKLLPQRLPMYSRLDGNILGAQKRPSHHCGQILLP
ncbi:hypothetical protein BGZ61DRAFT_464948 [Ilyonectria robusta]|uniref:uncharacterized protein n=1 Tax=Ilyonectria robusta TaxID=1079257 RepID=UPI001E8D5BCC|nr:uncharacterized protein BGZ61DRAFT_464948 [Ilyonectria robusta]KAH8659703.1 hypothetical protein BGZ61DRAFT_464948 [Ilyonectria robusta]